MEDVVGRAGTWCSPQLVRRTDSLAAMIIAARFLRPGSTTKSWRRARDGGRTSFHFLGSDGFEKMS
jgi:hypothetical protein